jgi:HAD superfamily hydrolase (TIGR01459 family)
MNFTFYEDISFIDQGIKGLIVDLWGVIHDGQQPYPNVIPALEQFKNTGKKVLFLSNAPRRAYKAEEALANLGIGASLYDMVLTSGEVTYNYLKDNPSIGKKYIYIGPEKDRDITDGLPLEMVEKAADADFALVTGFDKDDSTLEEKLPQIEDCLAFHLPLICANPDLEVVRQNGTRMLCAGVIAEYYAAQGGEVTFFGKPYPEVYKQALALLELEAKDVLAIGDSLETDIKGANDAGVFSVLATSGILAEKLFISPGETPLPEHVQAVCAIVDIYPKAVIPGLKARKQEAA